MVGGIAWIASLVYAGYLFGNIPWVKDNLSLIVIGIVVVSLIPAVTTFVREHRRSGAASRIGDDLRQPDYAVMRRCPANRR